MKQNLSDNKVWKICIFVCALMSIVAAIVKIFVGFDIDEAYAVTMPYRLLQGDGLFKDMWEVHQTSSFLPAVFCTMFVQLTGGIEHLVIFLRIVATLIHLCVTVWLYVVIKKAISKRNDVQKVMSEQEHYATNNIGDALYFILPWFVAMCYFNFLPKWLISPDFSMQQLWFTTICLLFLFEAVTKEKKRHYVFAGLSLAMAVLAYPGMVFVYPFLLVSIRVLTMAEREQTLDDKGIHGRKEKSDCEKKSVEKIYVSKKVLENCLYFTLGCVVAAVAFFIYLFSYMNVQELLQAIPMVFSDGSHQYDMATKLMLYAKQWFEVLIQSGVLVAPSVIVTFVYIKIVKETFTFARFFAMFLLMTSGIVICAELLGISWGPFRLQVRYLLLFFGGIYFYLRKKRKTMVETYVFWLGLFPSVGMLLGILLASNVGPSSSASYLVIGDIAAIFLVLTEFINVVSGTEMTARDKSSSEQEKADQVKRSHEQSPVVKRKLHFSNLDSLLIYGSMFAFVISLIMCKGFYVRVTEYPPANVLEKRVKLTEGAAKGIWVYPNDAKRMEDDYLTIAKETQSGDKILFLGTESLNNLTSISDGKNFVSPTTISTPAFNEQWTAYFTMHPEKQPDVIFIAKNTVDNREKFFAKNHFGKWIAKYYDIENMTETDSLCVIKK